jgi:hypothetical protein
MAQYCKKLAAMSWFPTTVSSVMIALRGERAGADLLLNKVLRGDRLRSLLTLPGGEVGEVGEVLDSFMESGESLATLVSRELLNCAYPSKTMKRVGR